METLKILVNSMRPAIGNLLKKALATSNVNIEATEPGSSFLEAMARTVPDIAVVDFAEGRERTAELEIDLLRTIRADVQVIPIGRGAVGSDADVLGRIRREAAGRSAVYE